MRMMVEIESDALAGSDCEAVEKAVRYGLAVHSKTQHLRAGEAGNRPAVRVFVPRSETIHS
jgi:hypothetical protein